MRRSEEMEFPYQRLRVSGNILVAAQAARIHTFSLGDGSHLGTWSHPKAESSHTAPDKENGAEGVVTSLGNQENGSEVGQVPPAKRRKLDAEDGSGEADAEAQTPEGDGQGAVGKKAKKPKGEKQKHDAVREAAAERLVVTVLEITRDRRHVVAVTGQDKTIWVFEHDGNGTLTQLSNRVMPKRPCSVAITPECDTIICADKFGDVYSLPLLTTTTATSGTNGAVSPRPAGLPPSKPLKLEANEFTVHSRRNLASLANQKRQQELRAARDAAQSPADAASTTTTTPTADAALQLGHVSMLTAVLLASAPGPDDGPAGAADARRRRRRDYIITADRDEHIRVSRGLPQAHVVEAFCLGHADFVSALCLPRPAVLVSGGGDPDLFVWDWAAGRLRSRVPLLQPVRAVRPDTARVAVTGLYAARGPAGAVEVLALCECVPAVFCFRLEDEVLEHRQTVMLPGNPLDLAIGEQDDGPARMVVTTMSTSPQEPAEGDTPQVVDGSGLLLFELQPATGWTNSDFKVRNSQPAEAKTPYLSSQELEKVLFTTEVLRKQSLSEDADAES